MRRGRIPYRQNLQNVTEIRDVNFYGDGDLYTLQVFREDVIEGPGVVRRLKEDAFVLQIARQEAAPEDRIVRIPEAVLRRARERFKHKRVPDK